MSRYHRYPKLSRALAAWIARPMHVRTPDAGRVEAFVFFDSSCEDRARNLQVCLYLAPHAEACTLPLAWEDGEPDLVEAMVTTYLHQAAARLAVRAIKAKRTAPPRKGGRP
jgi:hypothetical protein